MRGGNVKSLSLRCWFHIRCSAIVSPPRWLWIIVAFCVLSLTVAALWKLRYTVNEKGMVYDHWTGTTCVLDTCFRRRKR